MVQQTPSTDIYGVGVHIDIPLESEKLLLGVVSTVRALDHLAVLVAHGCTALEYGDAVTGIVVKEVRPQGIAVLVQKLDLRSPELGKVVVDNVVQTFA